MSLVLKDDGSNAEGYELKPSEDSPLDNIVYTVIEVADGRLAVSYESEAE